MFEVTIDSVVSAIATKIRQAFSINELKEIYKDKPSQDAVPPCAFIHQLNFEQTSEMRGRANRSHMFDIRIHPLENSNNYESWSRAISEKLVGILDTISVVGQQVKSSSITITFQDNVLHCIVSYNFKVKTITSLPKMEDLTLIERVK
jgi:hypothetical protein